MKLLTLAICFAALALGAEHGAAASHDEASTELMWKWINFGILAVGLGYVFVKSGVPFFRGRAAGIVADIADAAKTKAEAEARASELEKRIANLSGEIDKMRTDAKAELVAEGKRIQAETEQTVAKAAAAAENEIASATKAARQELSAHAAQLALDLAAGKLRQSGAGAQPALFDSFVRDLQKLKN